MLRKIFYIAGGLVLTIALLGSMGLGAWNYTLNDKLEKSQSDYEALQGKYDQLVAEHTQSKAEYESKLGTSRSELEATQAEVTKLERELEQAQSKNKALQNQLSSIQGKVAMLHAFWFTSEASFANRVEKSGDEQLKQLYKALGEEDSWEAFVSLMSYLIESISETSGIQASPIVNAVSIMHGG